MAMGLSEMPRNPLDVNCLIIAIASMMSLNQSSGGRPKEKNRLALRSFKYSRPNIHWADAPPEMCYNFVDTDGLRLG
jgi:hypothetical protein